MLIYYLLNDSFMKKCLLLCDVNFHQTRMLHNIFLIQRFLIKCNELKLMINVLESLNIKSCIERHSLHCTTKRYLSTLFPTSKATEKCNLRNRKKWLLHRRSEFSYKFPKENILFNFKIIF